MENVFLEISSTLFGFKHSFICGLNKIHVLQLPKDGDTVPGALKSLPTLLLPGLGITCFHIRAKAKKPGLFY